MRKEHYFILFLIVMIVNINYRYHFAIGGEFLLLPIAFLLDKSYQTYKVGN